MNNIYTIQRTRNTNDLHCGFHVRCGWPQSSLYITMASLFCLSGVVGLLQHPHLTSLGSPMLVVTRLHTIGVSSPSSATPWGAHSLLSTCGLCKFVPSISHLYKETQGITHTITRSRELREGPMVERGTKCRGAIIHMCYSNLPLSCMPKQQFCATDGVVHRTNGAAVAWLTENTNSYHRLGLLSE
jgi:hypothetical protein